MEVHWTREKSSVYLAASYKNTTCGLCGNYNDNSTDDWVIGELCPEPGTVLTEVNTDWQLSENDQKQNLGALQKDEGVCNSLKNSRKFT